MYIVKQFYLQATTAHLADLFISSV